MLKIARERERERESQTKRSFFLWLSLLSEELDDDGAYPITQQEIDKCDHGRGSGSDSGGRWWGKKRLIIATATP